MKYIPIGKSGYDQQVFSVYFDDEKMNPITGYISANVNQYFTILPSIIDFGKFVKNKTEKRIISITANLPNERTIRDVRVTSNYINVDRKDYNIGEDKILSYLTITLSSTCPIGDINEQLLLSYSENTPENIRVKIVGEIVGNYEVTPKVMNLGIIKKQSHIKSHIYLKRSSNNEDVEIKEIKCNLKNDKVANSSVERVMNVDPSIVEYLVDVETLSEDGLLEGEITINSSGMIQPLITIPVVGIIR